MTVAVELRGLRLRYPGGSFQLAVDELQVAAGERVAVVGPSGSGKTTLLHLLAGLLLPDAGQVRVGGADLVQWSDRERRRWRATQVGLSFQDLSLIPYLDGLANLLLPLRLQRRGGPDASAVARARDLARTFGVEHTLGRRPAQLSGGEQQRLALARALIGEPSLLLLDEPTGSLDADNAARAVEALLAAAERRGATMLLVTHDGHLAARFPRVLDAGRAFADRERSAVAP